jgi:predicted nucleic acid-binding protein
MKPVFGDTVYFLALLNSADQWHSRACVISADPPGPLVTTGFVLLEVGDALSRHGDHARFAGLLQVLRVQPDVKIVPVNQRLFEEACALHVERGDKDWSLTDCTSFVLMRADGVNEALTSDHHFEQAGFVALMK